MLKEGEWSNFGYDSRIEVIAFSRIKFASFLRNYRIIRKGYTIVVNPYYVNHEYFFREDWAIIMRKL